MINYLEKYNNLPKELKDKISAPHVMNAMHELEERYDLSLATLIMRVMVKDLHVDGLHKFLMLNHDMDSEKAAKLVSELKNRIFSEISNYIDYISENSELKIENEKSLEEYSEKFGLSKKPAPETVEPIKKTAADFYFSIEDEDEVRTQAKDFSQLDRREQIAMQVENKIDEIIGEINVIFSSEDMLKRLRQVLKTYLRGVRDKIDTKQALEREIINGGLGLDEEIADDILKIVDTLNAMEAKNPTAYQAPKKFLLPEDKKNSEESVVFSNNSVLQDVEYDFSKLGQKKTVASEDAMNIKIDTEMLGENEEYAHEESSSEEEMKIPHEENVQKEPIVEETSDILDKAVDLEKKKLIEEKEKALVLDLSGKDKAAANEGKKEEIEKKPEVATEPAAPAVAVEATAPIAFNPGMMAKARNKPMATLSDISPDKQFGNIAGKVKMEDIKKVAKLGGPLEEITSMNLNDFRRLSKSPKEAAAKIIEMFNLLEEEGFNKRMLGLKAWRQNPVNSLYLSIGQESIIKKKEIKKIIEMRKSENKEYLSQEEFDAIMELNKKLRY